MNWKQGEAVGSWRPPSRPRWTASDGEAMVAAFEASGQTEAAFARSHGIGVQRVRYWREKTACRTVAHPARDAEPGFVAVRVVENRHEQTESTATDGTVEVILRNGVRLAFTGRWSAAEIAPWLHALENS